MQKNLVENHAKESRRQLHIGGYSEVGTSNPKLVTLGFLNSHYKNNGTFANPLTAKEFTQLYKCYHGSSCKLWYYESFASMYGGSGSTAHFVLIQIPRACSEFRINFALKA